MNSRAQSVRSITDTAHERSRKRLCNYFFIWPREKPQLPVRIYVPAVHVASCFIDQVAFIISESSFQKQVLSERQKEIAYFTITVMATEDPQLISTSPPLCDRQQQTTGGDLLFAWLTPIGSKVDKRLKPKLPVAAATLPSPLTRARSAFRRTIRSGQSHVSHNKLRGDQKRTHSLL